jgi:hypothetical protein
VGCAGQTDACRPEHVLPPELDDAEPADIDGDPVDMVTLDT